VNALSGEGARVKLEWETGQYFDCQASDLPPSWTKKTCTVDTGLHTKIKFLWVVSGEGDGAAERYNLMDEIQITPLSGYTEMVRTKTTYNDVLGFSVDVTSPSGQVSSTRSDSLGRVRVMRGVDFGVRRNLRFDDNGNVIVSGDGDGTTTCTWSNGDFSSTPSSYNCQRTIGFAYDGLNRLSCVKYALSTAEMDNTGGAWPGTFTGTCPSGTNTKYMYDSYPDGPGGFCPPDNANYPNYNGRLTYVWDNYKKDPNNYRNCLYYGNRGLLEKEKRSMNDGATSYIIEYNYDNAGNLVSMTYPNLRVISYDYNELNQLEKVKVDGNLLQSLAYRPDGLVLSKTYKRTCS
jgi:YD repeat-containing protein